MLNGETLTVRLIHYANKSELQSDCKHCVLQLKLRLRESSFRLVVYVSPQCLRSLLFSSPESQAHCITAHTADLCFIR